MSCPYLREIVGGNGLSETCEICIHRWLFLVSQNIVVSLISVSLCSSSFVRCLVSISYRKKGLDKRHPSSCYRLQICRDFRFVPISFSKDGRRIAGTFMRVEKLLSGLREGCWEKREQVLGTPEVDRGSNMRTRKNSPESRRRGEAKRRF